MTREEAIKAFHTATKTPSSFADSAWIDRFVALGMLKLDGPKSDNFAVGKLVDACRGVPYLATAIQETLDAAGLKIVEK